MISLDQVFLLEQKVESAVAKIQQLQSENDALRTKCEQLTNALSVKSEQLSSFENDQNQIESGIKKALDRLNSIENSVLKAASMNTNGQAPVQQPQQPVQQQIVQTEEKPVIEEPVQQTIQSNVQTSLFNSEPEEPVIEENSPSFDTMEPSEPFESSDFSFENNTEEPFDENPPEEDSTDGLGFDIF